MTIASHVQPSQNQYAKVSNYSQSLPNTRRFSEFFKKISSPFKRKYASMNSINLIVWKTSY